MEKPINEDALIGNLRRIIELREKKAAVAT
jgi:hypothetical protein